MKERPSADRLFVYVTFSGLKHLSVLLTYVHFHLYLLTPSPPNRVVAIQPCTVNVILEVFSHSGYIERQRKTGRSNGGIKIFYHCVLGTFSFFLLLKRTRPHGFAISRSLDLRLQGSSQRSHSPQPWNSATIRPQFLGSACQCYLLRCISPK